MKINRMEQKCSEMEVFLFAGYSFGCVFHLQISVECHFKLCSEWLCQINVYCDLSTHSKSANYQLQIDELTHSYTKQRYSKLFRDSLLFCSHLFHNITNIWAQPILFQSRHFSFSKNRVSEQPRRKISSSSVIFFSNRTKLWISSLNIVNMPNIRTCVFRMSDVPTFVRRIMFFFFFK